MNKLEIILNSIEWLFLVVIIVGGRYWGKRFFRPTKSNSTNFLILSTLFALVYIFLSYMAGNVTWVTAMNLFITWLVSTAFYPLLSTLLFKQIEGMFGYKQLDNGEFVVKDDGPGSNPPTPPPPPPGTQP